MFAGRVNNAVLFSFCLIATEACADPVQVDLPRRDCIRLLADSPVYVPGISSTGKNVVPADLNDSSSLDVTMPVYLDLERNFPFWQSRLQMGVVPAAEVNFQNGRIFVNGSMVSENGLNALQKACKRSLEKEKIDKNNLTPVQ